ncbi:ABC transporter substrate-binding protein [Goodfellowiella coeruleoviolacea]|uniref:Peptide/nickel transport system substrate-binding protein n=1 Tax=Goodfellowiella coeruleoviolacea TaxID=334858 RepID=A0AAE3G995_9PSEU|nr:ABC transporter substrate-binding protein [Goodfellowiella coeruleoviolacea]MCP2163608.1 peptide/nickel transport system substrate-binding protein [Goodfellowiella coeruleoviolacea]
MRRRNLLRGLALVTAAASAVALAGCNANARNTASTQTQTATTGGTLYILSDAATQNYDPAKSANLATTSLALVHRRLTAWNVAPGQPAAVVPDLTTDTGKPSDDGRTWTYTLREGLKFSDGTPIRSQDVKWGVERSFAPAFTGGGLGYHKTLLVGGADYRGPFEGQRLASIETPDERTLVFHLARPYGDWPWIVSTPAFAPVPEGKGAEADYSEHPVASGPYQLAEYQKGVRAKLTRNPNWDKNTDSVRSALPDEVVFQLGQDTTVISQRLVADSGDDRFAFGASFVSPAQLAQLQNNASAKQRVVTSKSGALAYLALNTQKGPLADPKVRQAFQYAVDKSAYQIASAGSAQLAGDIATTLITEGIPGREQYDLYPTQPTGDPDRAKQLLAEAGYPNGLDNLDFVVANTNNLPEKAQAVQASLARAGIKTNIRSIDRDAYDAEVTGNQVNYDLTLSSWQPDFPSANANLQPLFASSEIGNGGYNLSRYRNPEVDQLIERAQSTVDPTEAGRQWAEIDKKIQQDSPVVPLIYTRNSFLHGSKVANFFIADFPAYPNYLQIGVTP